MIGGRGQLVALAAALAVVPWIVPPFYAELMTKVMIMAIFAMSLDLLVGQTGLASFGHAAYFGLAAYSVVLLSPEYDPGSFWLTLPAAIGLAALAAFVNGLVILRTRGLYFVMATLAFAQMMFHLFHDTSIGGGSDGRYVNFRPVARFAGATLFDLGQPRQFYYVVLALLVLVFVFLAFVLRSPFGRALAGIKTNEQRMRSLGFPVYLYRLGSFTVAGGLAGLAGFLFACQDGFVNPEYLSWKQSGNVLLMVILGGMGRLGGAFLGALAFIAIQEVSSMLTKHWQLVMGGIIVALVLFLPRGLVSLVPGRRGADRD